jgi:SET domain-containing protein 6
VCDSKASAFTAWLIDHGTVFQGVRLQDLPDGSIGVVATRAIRRRAPLVTVPQSLVLSLKTASSEATEALLDQAQLDKEPADGGFPDSAVQTLLVAYHISLGAASRWYPYFVAISTPPCEDLPIVWDERSLTWLCGTGVDDDARKWRAELLCEHQNMVTFLRAAARGAEGNAMAALSFESYVAAASLMASRAFFIDDSHGDALCPACDAFNHKASLSPRSMNASDDDDDDDEGEGEGDGDDDGHDNQDDEDEDDEEECLSGPRPLRSACASVRAVARMHAAAAGMDLGVDCTFDSAGGGAQSDDEEGEEEGDEEGESEGELESGDGAEVEDDAQDDACAQDDARAQDDACGVVMQVAMRPIRRGVQVHTSYGEYGNAKLLLDYGFALEDNPLDTARLPMARVRAVLGTFGLSLSQLTARESALTKLKVRWMAPLLACDGFEFDRSGVPPRRLLLRLWLTLMPKPPTRAAEAEAIRDAFGQMGLAIRLQGPARASLSVRAVLQKAVAEQLKGLRERPAAIGDGRREIGARRLVRGHIHIWQSVLGVSGAAD